MRQVQNEIKLPETILFLVWCVLEFWLGRVGVVSVLQAEALLFFNYDNDARSNKHKITKYQPCQKSIDFIQIFLWHFQIYIIKTEIQRPFRNDRDLHGIQAEISLQSHNHTSQHSAYSTMTYVHGHKTAGLYPTPMTHNPVSCIIIGEVAPRSHSRNPGYCLLSEYWNPVWKNLLQTSVCSKFDPPQPTPPPPDKTGTVGPLSMPKTSMHYCHIAWNFLTHSSKPLFGDSMHQHCGQQWQIDLTNV